MASPHGAGMIRLHATCVDVDGHGVLLQGPSAAGKSDLALRLIADGARLVSDDYTDIDIQDGRLVATGPEPIRGLLEIRGLGILCMDADARVEHASVAALIELVAPEEVERLPNSSSTMVLSVPVPTFHLTPFEASAVAKVRLAVGLATGRILSVP